MLPRGCATYTVQARGCIFPIHETTTSADAGFDFDDPDHEPEATNMASIQQYLAAFGSKVFIVWDPQRCMDSLAFELHVGAHVVLDEHVHAWQHSCAQDVISSIAGVQALLPLFRSMIAVGGAAGAGNDKLLILPNLFHLVNEKIDFRGISRRDKDGKGRDKEATLTKKLECLKEHEAKRKNLKVEEVEAFKSLSGAVFNIE